MEEVTSNEMSKSERTLETYLKKFVDLKLLIRSNEVSGGYFVNPKYMFKGTLKERERVIKGLFEKAANGKVSFEPLLDKPISEYFDDHEGKLFAR
ncbi:replication/maintenance protein RepL [Algoriphagus boritolerans]|uniref:replication/maintenance protein RepL n=1 Tax=Algoriphagus boritolerans TaxID=308111 RepID=UPI0011B0AC68|nr:replication/maintenance protein RepL [Algoriphagus boritolerans]